MRKEVRGNGIGQMMGRSFLPLARDLGYLASFFNLVFVSNTVRLVRTCLSQDDISQLYFPVIECGKSLATKCWESSPG